ncbi:MAG: efflux transporter outer membrane subunit, partial [Bdellovibrionales bacterium]|nr:efflux transporter outer membrane subunit [Bdellovibrionales bacterium]
PDYESPAFPLPEAWQESLQQPKLPEQLDLAQYWKMFSDDSLTKLIEESMHSNLPLQEAALRVEEALAYYDVERSKYFPELTLDSDLQRRRRSAAVSSAISDQTTDFVSAGGFLNWELDILGRVRRLNESAVASAEASVELYYGTLISLQAEVATAYIEWRTLQNQVALTQKNIDIQKESLALAKQREAAGVAPELDVKQAQSNLGQTEAALPLLNISLAESEHRIAVLLSKYPGEMQDLLKQGAGLPTIPVFSNASLPLDIIRQRPDIRQAERELAAQHALIGAAQAELFPIVSLPGQFSFEALNTLENAFRKGSFAYSIGPNIQWNIVDFKRRRSMVAAQDLKTQQLEKRYQQRVITAVKEVEDALVSLQQERLRVEALKRSVAASIQSERLVRSLYLSGLTDFQNVLDSERRLFEQELSLTQSEGNTVMACVQLFRALGGGWSNTYKQASTEIEIHYLDPNAAH